MTEPIVFDVQVHPCNQCGTADPLRIWYPWRMPGYYISCTFCPQHVQGVTAEDVQELWNAQNPSADVSNLPHVIERRTREATARREEQEMRVRLAALLTPELLPALQEIVEAYEKYGENDEFSAETFLEWCQDILTRVKHEDPSI